MSRQGLRDKVIILTGASSGIGRATAIEMARHGARLVLAARREALLREVAERVAALGHEALVVPTDVTDRAEVQRLVAAAMERYQRVDVYVSNAGQYIRRPIAELTIPDCERSMTVNFYSHLYGVLSVLPHMLARRSGHLVFVSTLDAKKGIPLDGPYVAAKSALAGLGDVMRQELRSTGVHVTTVFPGRIDTPMLDEVIVPWVSPKIPAEAVARATIKGIRRHKAEVIVPRVFAPLMVLNALSPRLGDWIVRAFHLEGRTAGSR
jgi:NADP-dependent 3-hydroxy acid dehydrogenase YdfG